VILYLKPSTGQSQVSCILKRLIRVSERISDGVTPFPIFVTTRPWSSVYFTMNEKSDRVTCALPQLIGPVDDNPTIAYMLVTPLIYQ